jgi:hypothetical protein
MIKERLGYDLQKHYSIDLQSPSLRSGQATATIVE